ncbi:MULTISPECIES: EF-hand domain-containing protein [Saccharothrix]|uniref:Calcium-binding protein n=2 Tax=Saccharothrix TaxID=2071 RepID=A0ABU0X426_9PSEU|nr:MULTISPECIES: EF-hand domain-containing protein [Saccharothrix]MDQ2586888.1 calcium-binding protein [Saccharothrix yanglingensis]MDR6594146.1 Ca2+-binding EF-hand superfamily protein [Saccharothrix longispora]
MTTTVTSILTRKLNHMFRILDTDQDGHLTARDMPAMADALAVPFAEQPEKVERLRAALLHIWEAHLERMDEDGDGRLTAAEYELGVRTALAEDADALLDSLNDTVAAWFSLFDADADGYLELEEYVRLGEALGVPPQDMKTAFRRLDRDADGRLPPCEVREAVVEYFTSEDPEADGNWLYGPL